MFLLGILIFKGLTARRLCKSFGVKGLIVIFERGIVWYTVLSFDPFDLLLFVSFFCVFPTFLAHMYVYQMEGSDLQHKLVMI
jgi:hypothetical protein